MLHNIVKPAAVLFIVCLVVTAAVSFTHTLTKDTIEQRAALDAENARLAVLPGADEFILVENTDQLKQQNDSFEKINEVYRGVNNENLVGYVFRITTKGYGGEMEITVGIDYDGTITGVEIGANSETPGLGAKASDDEFISQFSGITPDGLLTVIKNKKTKPEEIDAISGATITSRAVTDAVQTAVDMSIAMEGRSQ